MMERPPGVMSIRSDGVRAARCRIVSDKAFTLLAVERGAPGFGDRVRDLLGEAVKLGVSQNDAYAIFAWYAMRCQLRGWVGAEDAFLDVLDHIFGGGWGRGWEPYGPFDEEHALATYREFSRR